MSEDKKYTITKRVCSRCGTEERVLTVTHLQDRCIKCCNARRHSNLPTHRVDPSIEAPDPLPDEIQILEQLQISKTKVGVPIRQIADKYYEELGILTEMMNEVREIHSQIELDECRIRHIDNTISKLQLKNADFEARCAQLQGQGPQAETLLRVELILKNLEAIRNNFLIPQRSALDTILTSSNLSTSRVVLHFITFLVYSKLCYIVSSAAVQLADH